MAWRSCGERSAFRLRATRCTASLPQPGQVTVRSVRIDMRASSLRLLPGARGRRAGVDVVPDPGPRLRVPLPEALPPLFFAGTRAGGLVVGGVGLREPLR